MRRGGAEPAAAIARTRSRSSGGASGRVERGGEALGEARLLGLRQLARERVLAADASPLRPEVVERDRAGELAEPGSGAAAGLVEAVPEADGALEGLGRQILREAAVAGQV